MAVTTYVARATMTKVFKHLYAPRIVKQYYTGTPVMARLRKATPDDLDFAGDQFVIPVKTGWSEGVGTRAEGDNLPTAYYPPVDQMNLDVKLNYGVIQLTRVSMKASRSPGAWERLLDLTMEDVRENLIWDGARQRVFGTGTGTITQINGTAASATQTVDDTSLLRPRMLIDVFTAESGGSQDVNSIRILSITNATTIVLASSQTCNDNSYVSRAGTRNNDFMGLAGIMDDGTRLATFQGIDRTAAGNDWLKANRLGNSGTNRSLTVNLMNQGMVRSEQTGGGGYPSAIYMNHALGLIYADLVGADRRFIDTKDLDGGFKGISHTGPGGTAPIILDRMVRANEIWFPYEADFFEAQLSELQFVDEDGAVLSRITNKDEFGAYMAEYANLGAYRCNRSTVLADVDQALP